MDGTGRYDIERDTFKEKGRGRFYFITYMKI